MVVLQKYPGAQADVNNGVVTVEVKKNLWDLYNKIDPDYGAGDLVLNVNVFGSDNTRLNREYVVLKGDSLSKIGKKYGVTWKDIL